MSTVERRDRGRNCGTCDYWQPRPEHRQPAGSKKQIGECRRRAPINPTLPGEVGCWPVMVNEQWCGEYEPCADAFSGEL